MKVTNYTISRLEELSRRFANQAFNADNFEDAKKLYDISQHIDEALYIIYKNF